MRTRGLGRGLCALIVVSPASIAAASCGGANDSNVFQTVPDASGGDEVTLGDAGTPEAGSFGDATPDACVPKTCTDLGYTCGKNGDGCGGTVDCGTCTSLEYCGGGGYSKCGGSNGMQPDGAPIANCTPATCQSLNIKCGQTGDGCGNTLDCGSCTNQQ
jgi:hypothetical protein